MLFKCLLLEQFNLFSSALEVYGPPNSNQQIALTANHTPRSIENKLPCASIKNWLKFRAFLLILLYQDKGPKYRVEPASLNVPIGFLKEQQQQRHQQQHQQRHQQQHQQRHQPKLIEPLKDIQPN